MQSIPNGAHICAECIEQNKNRWLRHSQTPPNISREFREKRQRKARDRVCEWEAVSHPAFRELSRCANMERKVAAIEIESAMWERRILFSFI